MTTCNNVQYDQGTEGSEVFFQLVCQNVPIGTIVTLTSDNSNGPQPPIVIPPTTVQFYPSFITGVYTQVPANYECILTYCYTLPAGVTPPPGFSVTVQASIPVDTKQKKAVRQK